MALSFFQETAPDYYLPTRVSDRVIRILCKNPSPYTYTGTSTYIIEGETLAIIDPGPVDMAHGDALLKAIDDRTVSHIFVTHTHSDHSPLSAWLKEQTGATVYAYGPHGYGRRDTTGGLDGETVEAGADTSFEPDVYLEDRQTIGVEGWTICAHYTPGHTSNHMCFELMEEKTLFVGDHVMGWATTVIMPPDGDMHAYLDSLEKLRKLNSKLLIPTHGPHIPEPNRFMRAIIVHRKMREGQILKLLREGVVTIDAMVARMYKEVDPRLHPAAARSVLSHLIALTIEGRVTSEDTPTLASIYRISE